MDTEINVMKEQISELNSEYTSGMRAAAVLQRRAAGGQQRVAMLNRTIQQHERQISHLQSTIARFSRDVETIVSAPGGGASVWAEGLLKLYREYVTNEKGKIQGPDAATQAEFNRQRQFMERAMEALKKGAKRSDNEVKNMKKKNAIENGALVAEINRLRKESRQLKNKIGALETSLENTKRGNKSGFRSKLSGRPEDPEAREQARADIGAALKQLSSTYSSSSDAGLDAASSESERVSSLGKKSRIRPSTAGVQTRSKSFSTSSLRPKPGGRPLTAAQRRRKMPKGPSLSRSMQALRANQSEMQLERLRAHNSRLVSQNMSLSRRLTMVTNHASDRSTAHTFGSKTSTSAESKNVTPSSPPSSDILSRYNNFASAKQRPHSKGMPIKSTSVKGFPTGARGRQQLSPLVKETLRVA